MQSLKCIIFSRVSSDRQSFDEQTLELRQLAEQYGYPPDTHMLIEYKESGIRLKEEDRLGLTEMKEMISDNPQINCVFASEISRIARTKKVLFSIQDFLVQRKIQLIIAEPRIVLLNPDSTINDAADFAFTMYSQYAESEMRQKQDRFKRGRERSKREGKWHGGRLLYGFKVVDKRLVPDESLAPIVRHCFEIYSDGQSQEYVAKYLEEFGVKRKGHNIAKMLNNPKYVEIVGRELFDAVQAAKTSRKQPPKYRLHSPGERKMKCSECGRHYVHITTCYVCLGRLKPYHDCKSGFSINARWVDALLFTFSKYGYAARLHVTRIDDEERIRQTLSELPKKLDAAQSEWNRLNNKRFRVMELYTEGRYTKDTMERSLKIIDRQMDTTGSAIKQMIEQQASLQVTLDRIASGQQIVDSTLDSLKNASKREIYDLVQSEVDYVELYKVGRFKYMKVNLKAGFSNLARFSGQGCSFKCEIEANGIWTEFFLDK